MSVTTAALAIWLLVTVVPLLLAISRGAFRIYSARCQQSVLETHLPWVPLEVLVPLKGVFPDQEEILNCLLEQNYPAYQVTFILESEEDPANAVLDSVCLRHPHARKIISGVSVTCGQKNHSLVAGIKQLKPDTEILVFCDSTNKADRDWLLRLTAPLRSGEYEVVTTFRTFRPEPETLGGVSQAIYASFVLTLIANKPKPWGGATAISRTLFEKLNVGEAWSKTVVDDLVLGNILDRAGIKVGLDPCNLLTSPLRNQSVKGFVSYLDRQILFPKFTNPAIWAITLLFHLNMTLVILVTALMGMLFPAGYVGAPTGSMAYGFLALMALVGLALRRLNPFSISIGRWLAYFVPCVFLAAFVLIRSVFRNHIEWHGRTYWPGKGGIVRPANLK